MSSKHGNGNIGRPRDDHEYNEIVQQAIRGVSFENLGRQFQRKPYDQKRAFLRVCRDAGAYNDQKIYDLKPPAGELWEGGLNWAARTFIREQFKRSHSAENTALRMGFPVEKVLDYINSIPKPRERKTLFEVMDECGDDVALLPNIIGFLDSISSQANETFSMLFKVAETQRRLAEQIEEFKSLIDDEEPNEES